MKDHSIQNYLKKLPTEVLTEFLKEAEQNGTQELSALVLSDIRQELAFRNGEKNTPPTLLSGGRFS